MGEFSIAEILLGLGLTPSGLIMCPRYAIDIFKNFILNLNLNLLSNTWKRKHQMCKDVQKVKISSK